MIEIAKCPVCGGSDVIRERESGDCNIEYWTEYECFDKGWCYDNGPTFRTAESWNKYAEAMGNLTRYKELVAAVKRLDASSAREQKKCLEDMTEEEYHAWHTERIAARAEVDKLLTSQ